MSKYILKLSDICKYGRLPRFPLLFRRTGATWRRQLDFAERLHFTQPQDIPTNHVNLIISLLKVIQSLALSCHWSRDLHSSPHFSVQL